jgi:hypothetical protein
MSDKNLDEMELNELIGQANFLQIQMKTQSKVIEAMREELASSQSRLNSDYRAANVAVGAIYRFVDLIRSVPVTHAQREGNLLLLIAFIDRAWPSHSGRYAGSDDASDIPF